MPKPEIVIQRERASKNEIGSALINPDTGLSNTVLMSDQSQNRFYLPVYKLAVQSSGGTQAFTPSLQADGMLTMYLEAAPSPEIASQAGAAKAYSADTAFTLAIQPSGSPTRIPLTVAIEGGAIYRISVKLAGDNLERVRAALFDLNPNVAIEIAQSVLIAAPMSEKFVRDNWSDPTLNRAFQNTLQVPFDSLESFLMVAGQVPGYWNEYLVMQCTYRQQVAAPPLPGYIQWQVEWKSRAYNYYQDNRDRNRILYRPDGFELAKGPTGRPAVSLLQFSLPKGQSTVESTQATFRLFGKPVVQLDRIENARQTLKSKINGDLQMISLQDAHNLGTVLTQILPNATATSGNPLVQPNASIDLVNGVRNELNLNFAQFRALWAAIFTEAPEIQLLRGYVEVSLLDGRYKDRIDFPGRLPKDQEAAFFDDILDTSRDVTYSSPLTVKTFKKVFAGDKVLELEVNFGSGAVAMLNAGKIEASIEVRRSIRDIVLGHQDPKEFQYEMKVVRGDESVTCCQMSVKSDAASLWITSEMIAKCTGACT